MKKFIFYTFILLLSGWSCTGEEAYNHLSSNPISSTGYHQIEMNLFYESSEGLTWTRDFQLETFPAAEIIDQRHNKIVGKNGKIEKTQFSYANYFCKNCSEMKARLILMPGYKMDRQVEVHANSNVFWVDTLIKVKCGEYDPAKKKIFKLKTVIDVSTITGVKVDEMRTDNTF